jgi:hypothetical protein
LAAASGYPKGGRAQRQTAQGTEQPEAKRLWKQRKSLTFKIGGTVLPSQLAYVSPEANLVWKQMKSFTLRNGTVVLASQLA